MSRLAELQRELQRTIAAVVHAERTLAANPNVPSVAATLRTIQRRRDNLEEQFRIMKREPKTLLEAIKHFADPDVAHKTVC